MPTNGFFGLIVLGFLATQCRASPQLPYSTRGGVLEPRPRPRSSPISKGGHQDYSGGEPPPTVELVGGERLDVMHGTTTLAFVCDGGIIAAVDSRVRLVRAFDEVTCPPI